MPGDLLPFNPRTLFHLVPLNEPAKGSLLHSDNKRFVSRAASQSLALEVGFHVPSIPGGRVITRLGRNADLILREVPESIRKAPMVSVHVAFEIHPVTLVVMLSVRAKNTQSVKVSPFRTQTFAAEQHTPEPIPGDCVIVYKQDYNIEIASYKFRLVWRKDIRSEALKDLALRDYHESLERAKQLRSRDQPDGVDTSEVDSWHITRLHTVKEALIEEVRELRKPIGAGAFGAVFETVDRKSGNNFVVKEVNLVNSSNKEFARAAIHKEIKVLERLKHDNIIEYLGHQDFHTDAPCIFMPLREGNLTSLAETKGPASHNSICEQVLGQMLRALDCLAFNQLCHRDVKPDNILYRNIGQGMFHFQLADFGMANYRQLATTFCGTGYYQAPELYPEYGKFPQTPKMDVWSLFSTILAVHSNFAFPPVGAQRYDDVLRGVRAAAADLQELSPMSRENPTRRASAAQMLVALFDGQGLTTPRAQVPPIMDEEPDEEPPPRRPSGPQAPATRTRTVPLPVPPTMDEEPPRRPSGPKTPATRAMAAAPSPVPPTKNDEPQRRPSGPQTPATRTTRTTTAAPAPVLPLIVYPPPRQRRNRQPAPAPGPSRPRPGGIVKRRAEPRAQPRAEPRAKMEAREKPEEKLHIPGMFPE